MPMSTDLEDIDPDKIDRLVNLAAELRTEVRLLLGLTAVFVTAAIGFGSVLVAMSYLGMTPS